MARGAFQVAKLFYGLGGERVGLASQYVIDGINTITINAKDKEGKLKYPGKYQMLGSKIRTYPKKKYPGVPEQYFVSVPDLETTDQSDIFGGL